MDPPSSSLFPTTGNHPDSANSSPRSRHDAWDHDHQKLRLMCSYGGHIIPRPHDKSLCYVGGDTRMVVLDRHCSLADLRSRLSQTLLNGRHFSLKYQLPSEDLDSLISLATDEDLDNMIEEYDRTTLKPPSRLRLFLFPSMPETAASMGSLLDDSKSETWFVDALNGSGLLLPRGLSESAAAIDTLVAVDRSGGKEVAPEKSGGAQEQAVESPPVVETSSSSGSSSSSPSMANLPPIKVRAEEYLMVGLDEQLSSHMSIAAPLPVPFVAAAVRSGGGGEDERSEKLDHGTVAPTGLRKPPLPLPLPLQPVQRKLVDVHNLPSPDSKHATAYSLPSPDSVASDCSMGSGGSVSKHGDASEQQRRAANNNAMDPKMMQDPPQQQQFIHHHPPLPSYYPLYLPHHATADPHYPMYLVSPTQPSYEARPLPETLQVPAHHFQPHYIGVPQMQPNAAGNYGYDYSHHMQDQAYYAQHMPNASAAPPQYQTITPAAAVMFSAQISPDANQQHS